MPELKLLFLQMAVVLGCARLTAALFRRIGQPGVVGEMAAGILLGPSLLGRISPALMNSLFPAGGLGALNTLSQVGLILFMFLVGVETRMGSLKGSAKSVLLAAQASIVVPFAGGVALAWRFYPRLGEGVPRLPFALFLGVAISATAFPVLARILADRKMMQTRTGVFSIACAAFDDIAAWCLLAGVLVIANAAAHQLSLLARFALLGGYIAVMLLALRPIFKVVLAGREPGLGRFSLIMIFMLLSAATTEALGVHALFGAFLAGVVMPRDAKFETDVRSRLEPVTLGLLLPLFFAYTGLRTDIGFLSGPGLWWILAAIVLVAAGGKLAPTALAARWGGMPWRESWAVGVLVNCRGLVELVILNVGLDLRILSPTVFSIMVLMALATTLMTAPLLDWIRPDRTAIQP